MFDVAAVVAPLKGIAAAPSLEQLPNRTSKPAGEVSWNYGVRTRAFARR